MTSKLPSSVDFESSSEESVSVISKAGSFLSQLRALALDKQSVADRKKLASNAEYVIDGLALRGQITVFFAGPNTGKTLLTLRLIADAKREGRIDQEVFHLNLDDDYLGATTKAEIGLREGFLVLTPEQLGTPLENLTEIVDSLLSEGSAPKTILILDTVKKFVDVMDKKAMSAFMTICRKFSSAGGTLILLAHTNKIKEDTSIVIPGGTSDILDDCDCAYTITLTDEHNRGDLTERTILLKQKKARGPVLNEAAYSYQVNTSGDYLKLFESVCSVSPTMLQSMEADKRISTEQQQDQALIDAIKEALKDNELNKTELTRKIQEHSHFSRTQIEKCLKRWTGDKENGGFWITRSGPNNASLFSLPN